MDHAKHIRESLIAGEKTQQASLEAKRYRAKMILGDRYVLAGGSPDWSRPTVLTAWMVSRIGAHWRAGC